MRGFAATLFAAALCGCASPSPQWDKPGTAQDEVARDLAQCRQRAWREADLPARPAEPPQPNYVVVPGPGGQPTIIATQPPSDPFAGWPAEQRRFADACMREKGYSLVAR